MARGFIIPGGGVLKPDFFPMYQSASTLMPALPGQIGHSFESMISSAWKELVPYSKES